MELKAFVAMWCVKKREKQRVIAVAFSNTQEAKDFFAIPTSALIASMMASGMRNL